MPTLAAKLFDVAQVDEAEVVFGVVFMAGEDASEIAQPRKEPSPSVVAITAQNPAILDFHLCSPASMWGDHLNTLSCKLLI